jgi:hypothetical protein
MPLLEPSTVRLEIVTPIVSCTQILRRYRKARREADSVGDHAAWTGRRHDSLVRSSNRNSLHS